MRKLCLLSLILCPCFSCKVNQYTGKKTLNFFSNKQVFPVAFKEYKSFITKNPPIKNSKESNQIKAIGQRITAAAQAYFVHKGKPQFLKDYSWEYNLIDSKEKMPGVCLVEKLFSILAYSPLQKHQMESLPLWGMRSPMH